MSDAIQRLSRIAARAAAGEALGADGPWLADVIDQMFVGVEFQLAARLNTGWWRATFRSRRDQAIRALCVLVCPNGTLSDKIAVVIKEFRDYREGWRRRDQHKVVSPYSDPKVPEFWLFAIFLAGKNLNSKSSRRDLVPGEIQLRRILEAAQPSDLVDEPIIIRGHS